MNFDLDFAIRTFPEAVLGVPVTLIISVVAVIVGLPCAFFLAVARLKKLPLFSQVASFFISAVRGTPVIVQIFLIYTSFPEILKFIFEKYSIDYNVYDINPLIYAFVVYSVNITATYAEMWKSALSSVDKGQLEAAHSVGLTSFKAYIHIIIPQALSVAAPSFCSITLSMLKNTSLVFIMTVKDITARVKIASGLEYKYIEGYVDIFIVYLVVCFIIENLFKIWEKHMTSYRGKKDSVQITA